MILPKTTIEQRGQFYTDVEALLSPGFLTHPVVVAGTRLQLRSLGTGDLFMLRSRTEGCSPREWRVWTVSTAIWMVNGRSVLGHDDAVPFLAKYVSEMPDMMLGVLFSTALGLWVRVLTATKDVEAFIYESASRYRWKSTNRQMLDSGVPGASTLGLNTIQRIWMAFNEMEDSRKAEESTWEGFKFVASSNAPKAVAKIDQGDRQRRKDESEQRQRRLDQFFYEKLGVLSPDDRASDSTSSYRLATKSVEDLEDEMRRWVTGDADLHDQVVEEYKARIRAQREQEKAELAARRIALQAERERQEREAQQTGFRPQPLMALTGAQLQQMLQGRGAFGRSGTTFIPSAPHGDRLYEKYIAEGAVVAGPLQVDGNKVLDPESNPEMDSRTLNTLIKGRNPAFGSGG